MGNEVRDCWRTGASLRQDLLMTCYLSQHPRNGRIQLEMLILLEVPGNAAEIDRTKEVVKVDIKYIAAIPMWCGVGQN